MEGETMKQVHAAFSGNDLDYRHAAEMAMLLAAEDAEIIDPVLVAWCDRKTGHTSPVIEGSDPRTRWHDYGVSHGGKLEVDVGDAYDFIFADASAFDPYEASPYSNIKDQQGNEYVCQINLLSDQHSPTSEACTPLDEWTSKLT
jgi:hypothetical protein